VRGEKKVIPYTKKKRHKSIGERSLSWGGSGDNKCRYPQRHGGSILTVWTQTALESFVANVDAGGGGTQTKCGEKATIRRKQLNSNKDDAEKYRRGESWNRGDMVLFPEGKSRFKWDVQGQKNSVSFIKTKTYLF